MQEEHFSGANRPIESHCDCISNCKPRHILILRPDNIGDCVLFSGALRWIRDKYVDSQIHLAVKPHIRNLFELCPYVDRVVSFDRFFPWEFLRRYFLRGTWRLEECLLAESIRPLWYPHYDLVIYPVAAPEEKFLDVVRCLDAKEKWGFGGRMLRFAELGNPLNAPEKVFTRHWQNTDENMWKHELWRTKSFLEDCGVQVRDMSPQFWLSETDIEFASLNMPIGDVLGLFPGADSSFRCWPVEKWNEFFHKQQIAKSVVIFGGEKEKGVSAEVSKAAKGCAMTVLDLTGSTTLRQLAACMKACSWVVSMESSGLHLAVALGIPTVGLIGGHHLGRFYPWGNPAINRVAMSNCDGTHCNICKHEIMSCVRDIPVATVLWETEIAFKNSVQVATST
jgi:ADP-heptose:LPS heptosyltransferase